MGFYVGLSTNGTLIDEAMSAASPRSATTTSASASTASAPPTTASAARRARSTPRCTAIRLCRDAASRSACASRMTQDNAPSCRLCSTRSKPRASTSSTSRTSTTPAAATTTARRRRAPTTRGGRWTCCSSLLASAQRGDAQGIRHRQQRRRRRLPAALGAARAFPSAADTSARQAGAMGRQLLGREHRQHRQPRQRPSRHVLVALHARQRARRGRSPQIWPDTSDPLMAGLKRAPRRDQGPLRRMPPTSTSAAATPGCARCKLTGDPWEADPGCYLTDDEIGIGEADRVAPRAPMSRAMCVSSCWRAVTVSRARRAAAQAAPPVSRRPTTIYRAALRVLSRRRPPRRHGPALLPENLQRLRRADAAKTIADGPDGNADAGASATVLVRRRDRSPGRADLPAAARSRRRGRSSRSRRAASSTRRSPRCRQSRSTMPIRSICSPSSRPATITSPSSMATASSRCGGFPRASRCTAAPSIRRTGASSTSARATAGSASTNLEPEAGGGGARRHQSAQHRRLGGWSLRARRQLSAAVAGHARLRATCALKVMPAHRPNWARARASAPCTTRAAARRASSSP